MITGEASAGIGRAISSNRLREAATTSGILQAPLLSWSASPMNLNVILHLILSFHCRSGEEISSALFTIFIICVYLFCCWNTRAEVHLRYVAVPTTLSTNSHDRQSYHCLSRKRTQQTQHLFVGAVLQHLLHQVMNGQ